MGFKLEIPIEFDKLPDLIRGKWLKFAGIGLISFWAVITGSGNTERELALDSYEFATDEDRRLIAVIHDHEDSGGLVRELALVALDDAEEPSPAAYFIIADLIMLMDHVCTAAMMTHSADVQFLRRFVRGLATHYRSYDLESVKRPHDPGFYRHYVLAVCFDAIAQTLDVGPEQISARKWALVHYVRFLSNIQGGADPPAHYPPSVANAIQASRAKIVKLAGLIEGRRLGAVVTDLAESANYRGLASVYRDKSSVSPLLRALSLPELVSDQTWAE